MFGAGEGLRTPEGLRVLTLRHRMASQPKGRVLILSLAPPLRGGPAPLTWFPPTLFAGLGLGNPRTNQPRRSGFFNVLENLLINGKWLIKSPESNGDPVRLNAFSSACRVSAGPVAQFG